MVSLDSSEWADFQHAYGSASDIPELLRQLESFPDSEGTSEPWFSIWSALAHQGDVYSASFAAVPHVVKILAAGPAVAPWVYFQFPTWVEICRQRHQMDVPERLSVDYFGALKMLPALVCATSGREWDDDFMKSALSAIAIGKGYALMAEAIQELDDETAKEIVERHR